MIKKYNRDVNAAGKPGMHLTALEVCLPSQIGTIWIAPFVMGSYVYMQLVYVSSCGD